MGWDSLADYVNAVYLAQVLGIIDPRLEPMEVDTGYLTQQELDQMEEFADELSAE